jgi:hypothetical protein
MFLFKIATQGVSLWHFHVCECVCMCVCVYICNNLNWFSSSIVLLSTLVPFLWWFQQV